MKQQFTQANVQAVGHKSALIALETAEETHRVVCAKAEGATVMRQRGYGTRGILQRWYVVRWYVVCGMGADVVCGMVV